MVQPTKSDLVNRYKARLCAKGFRQQHGVNYEKICSPVVRYDILRVLLAMVAYEDLEMAQFDVKTAFHYGDLSEKIYISIPNGLQVPDKSSRLMCNINRALYGLKQASRCWNQVFGGFLSRCGFKACASDASVFIGVVNNEKVFLDLFVGHGLLIAKTSDVLDFVINALESRFEITILDPHIFVGVQIERDRTRRFILHSS